MPAAVPSVAMNAAPPALDALQELLAQLASVEPAKFPWPTPPQLKPELNRSARCEVIGFLRFTLLEVAPCILAPTDTQLTWFARARGLLRQLEGQDQPLLEGGAHTASPPMRAASTA
jgi:hypothetical protein